MKKVSVFEIIAIVSSIGIIGWIITSFFGGMIIYHLSYSLIIIPIICLYLISIIDTFVSIIRNRKLKSKIKFYSHSSVILAIVILSLYNSEIFKSTQILTATLKDDQFIYTLVLRENGNCENIIIGMFGFEQIYEGTFFLKGDTIIFSKKPYDNDFIPDTLLIDRHSKAIFLTKDAHEHFITEKEWLNHFEIK